jgi:hypothetical protein
LPFPRNGPPYNTDEKVVGGRCGEPLELHAPPTGVVPREMVQMVLNHVYERRMLVVGDWAGGGESYGDFIDNDSIDDDDQEEREKEDLVGSGGTRGLEWTNTLIDGLSGICRVVRLASQEGVNCFNSAVTQPRVRYMDST